MHLTLTIEYAYHISIMSRSTQKSIAQPPNRTAAQLRALAAPARQEIVDALETSGPASVAQIARLVGRPADALYHHLRALHRVGLVTEVERRLEGRHAFAVYDLCVRPLRIPLAASLRSADVSRVVAASQRLALRDFQRALVAKTGVLSGELRTLWAARAKGWADEARLRRINRLLAALLRAVRGGRPDAGASPISLAFVLAPTPVRRRAAKTSPQGQAPGVPRKGQKGLR